jgi:hypothetical protein
MSYKLIIIIIFFNFFYIVDFFQLFQLFHFATRVVNVTKNGCPLPLFFEDLKSYTNIKEVLSLSSILHTKIKIELPYSTKNDPPQCKNCQTYGHTAKYCHHPSRCV